MWIGSLDVFKNGDEVRYRRDPVQAFCTPKIVLFDASPMFERKVANQIEVQLVVGRVHVEKLFHAVPP
jgi:hypothetical protein